MILCSDVKGFMKYFCFLVGWSCKLLTKKKSFSDPKIGLKWPKHKWTVTMATCYIMIWNVNVVYLDAKSLPSTKYKRNIPFFYRGHVCRYYVKRPLKRHFSRFFGKKSSFEAVLSQQDTIAQVFDTRYGKTNVGPNHSRKENFLRPLASWHFGVQK